jgi:hypothetical protein
MLGVYLDRHCFRAITAGENAGPITQHHQPVRMVHNRARVERLRRVEAIVAVDDRLCGAALVAFE